MVVSRRGDIWWANLDPAIGHEQSGRRPVVIISDDRFNAGPRQLVMVLPMTRVLKRYRLHVTVQPSETGLRDPGAIMCDQLRTVSVQRLVGHHPVGRISADTLATIDRRLIWALGIRGEHLTLGADIAPPPDQ